ncbi:MAG: hypothetical protein LBU89_11390, partial [Fibromonadaceae bacterium]|nr:hypothetical protein [Fibromonadaceae bacterium]
LLYYLIMAELFVNNGLSAGVFFFLIAYTSNTQNLKLTPLGGGGGGANLFSTAALFAPKHTRGKQPKRPSTGSSSLFLKIA